MSDTDTDTVIGSVSYTDTNTDTNTDTETSAPEIYVKYGLLKFKNDFVLESLSHVFFDKSTNVVSGLSSIGLNGDLNVVKKQISDELKMTMNAQLLQIKKFENLNGYINPLTAAAPQAQVPDAQAQLDADAQAQAFANMAGV